MIKKILVLLFLSSISWAGIPRAISDLTASPGTNSDEVLLQWTAVGDNGLTGTANSYQIRYSTLSQIIYDDFIDSYTNAGLWTSHVNGNAAGSINETGGELYIYAKGDDVWTTRDDFRLLYTTMTWNFDFMVKISSQQASPSVYGQSGIVVRNSTATASNNAYTGYTAKSRGGSNGNIYYNMNDADENGYIDAYNASIFGLRVSPFWVMAQRRSTTFAMLYATGTTNINWTNGGSMPSYSKTNAKKDMIVGIMADSHDSNVVENRFDIAMTTGIYHWDRCSVAPSPPSPSAPGTRESFTISGLTLGTTYYFCARTQSASGNLTDGSNSPFSLPQTTSPAATIKKKAKNQVIMIDY